MSNVHMQNNNDHINLQNKKLIATITLFCKVLHNYLTNPIYKCPFIHVNNTNQNTFINLLNHIIIKDLSPKDITTPIITIQIDAISKLYSDHLTMYHSSLNQPPKQCLFHTYYSKNNKSINSDTNSNYSEQKEQKQQSVNKNKHSLNSNFIFEIINNSDIFFNKLHIKHTATANTNKYTIEIIKSLIYNNIDLNGTKTDAFIIAKTLQYNPTTNTPTIPIESNLTFYDIINASLHSTDSIDYNFFFKPNNCANKPNISTNKSNIKMPMIPFENIESNISTGVSGGMIYCSDYDEYEMDESDGDYNYTEDMYLKAPQFKMGLQRHLIVGLNKKKKKDLTNNLSSPTLPIKTLNELNEDDSNNCLSVKSVVAYDSNKFYIPFKGYGLTFKSQSNMSTNSQLPCAGKMNTTCTEGSVFCFDD